MSRMIPFIMNQTNDKEYSLYEYCHSSYNNNEAIFATFYPMKEPIDQFPFWQATKPRLKYNTIGVALHFYRIL